MASENRIEIDRLAFVEQIIAHPERFDFYHALRTLEGLFPESPLIGQAKRPAGEFFRLGQSPMLTFAPASLSGAEHSKTGKLRILIRFFGLFGPHGALPTHLTELAYERDLNYGDATLRRFADIFHHRAISFFYMIWRQAQPAANRDRPESDRFMDFIGALIGQNGTVFPRTTGFNESPARDDSLNRVPSQSKRYFAGQLGRLAKTPEGLAAILSEFFRIPVQVENFHPHWMPLSRDEQTRLSGPPEMRCLGAGATLGRRVYDAQHSIEVRLGPMDLVSYEAILPGGRAMASLKEWLKVYLGSEWFVQTRHSLLADQVPMTRLGSQGRLGWTSWLGRRAETTPADDLKFSI
jgi:type VI secretion system protein ImpH